MVMDARSVFDFLNSDSGKLPSDRRLALDLRLNTVHWRQGLAGPGYILCQESPGLVTEDPAPFRGEAAPEANFGGTGGVHP